MKVKIWSFLLLFCIGIRVCSAMKENESSDEEAFLDIDSCTCGQTSKDSSSAIAHNCNACCFKYNRPAYSNFFLCKPICFIYNMLFFSKHFAYYTPLHAAAQQGNKNMVRILIEKCRFDADRPDGTLSTPIFYALIHEHRELVFFLIEKYGCCVNTIDLHGFSLLYITTMEGMHEKSLLVDFFLKHGATLFTPEGSMNIILGACIHNDYSLVKMLLRWLITLAEMPVCEKLILACSPNTHKACEHQIRTTECVQFCKRSNKHFKQEALLFLLIIKDKQKDKNLLVFPKPLIHLILLYNIADEQAARIWSSRNPLHAAYDGMKELIMVKNRKGRTALDFVQKKGFKEIDNLFLAIMGNEWQSVRKILDEKS